MGMLSEPRTFWMAVALVFGMCAVMLGLLFGRPRGSVAVGLGLAAFCVAVFASAWLFPYLALAAALFAAGGHCWLIAIPLGRFEKGNVRSHRFQRHFRLKNFIWPVLCGGLYNRA